MSKDEKVEWLDEFPKGEHTHCYECGKFLNGKRSNWGTCEECDNKHRGKVSDNLKERFRLG